MTGRLIYDGCLAVDASDYTHLVEREDAYEEVELDGLDACVTRAPLLRFTLDYPFDRPFAGTVGGGSGVTLRQIIDAIRQGLQRMYAGSSREQHPLLVNQVVHGDHGQAEHAIEDLVIERITLDEAAGVLAVEIGS